MTDIRGVPATDWLFNGRLLANGTAPAGFTSGHRYWPLALGVDCAPATPVIYVLVADDGGTLRAVPVSAFTFTVDNLNP